PVSRTDSEDVCGHHRRVEPHVAGLPPPVRLAGKLVGDQELSATIEAERRHVQPDGGLSRPAPVEINDDEHDIPSAPGRVGTVRDLGKTQQIRLVSMVKPQVAELLKGRMGRRMGFSRGRDAASVARAACAPAQSRGRYWYFSEFRYSSLPGAAGSFSHSS